MSEDTPVPPATLVQLLPRRTAVIHGNEVAWNEAAWVVSSTFLLALGVPTGLVNIAVFASTGDAHLGGPPLAMWQANTDTFKCTYKILEQAHNRIVRWVAAGMQGAPGLDSNWTKQV